MGISIWQLLIVLVIVLLLFGTKKLRNLGSDLGGAVKGFKGAMNNESEGKEDGEKKPVEGQLAQDEDATVVSAEASKKEHDRV